MDLHAVAATGAKSQPLPGGRSRRTPNGVPVLELSNSSVDLVRDSRDALLDPEQETVYLTGHVVYMHTPAENSHGNPDIIIFHIGGETLDEAAKSCVGAFEDSYSNEPPTWVASSSPDLAKVISDHYHCPTKSMDEELSA